MGVVWVMEENLLIGRDGGCGDVGVGKPGEAARVGDGGDDTFEAGGTERSSSGIVCESSQDKRIEYSG